MPANFQYRTCQIDACSEQVPASLTQQGICVAHYLDKAFTQVAMALETCRLGRPLEPHTLDWVLSQGDLAVRLLSSEAAQPAENRSRLLDLLVCLGNVQEYMRHHSVRFRDSPGPKGRI